MDQIVHVLEIEFSYSVWTRNFSDIHSLIQGIKDEAVGYLMDYRMEYGDIIYTRRTC